MPEFAVWITTNSTHLFSAQEGGFISVEAADAGAALRAMQEMADEEARKDPDFRAFAEFVLPAESARQAVDSRGAVEIRDASAVFTLRPAAGGDAQPHRRERSHDEHIDIVKGDTSDNDAPYKSPEDVIKNFRGRVLFPATKRLTAHLEKERRNRIYKAFLYVLPDGVHDVSQQNSDHSLKEPFAVAEYSCGCWAIIR